MQGVGVYEKQNKKKVSPYSECNPHLLSPRSDSLFPLSPCQDSPFTSTCGHSLQHSMILTYATQPFFTTGRFVVSLLTRNDFQCLLHYRIYDVPLLEQLRSSDVLFSQPVWQTEVDCKDLWQAFSTWFECVLPVSTQACLGNWVRDSTHECRQTPSLNIRTVTWVN